MRHHPTSSASRRYARLIAACTIGAATSLLALACASSDPEPDADTDGLTSTSGTGSATASQTGSASTSAGGNAATDATGTSSGANTSTGTTQTAPTSSDTDTAATGGTSTETDDGVGGSRGDLGMGGAGGMPSGGGAGGADDTGDTTGDMMGAGGGQGQPSTGDDEVDGAGGGASDDDATGAGGAPQMEDGEGGAGGQGEGEPDPTAGTDGPCPTDGEPCKILPLGDSITDGIGAAGGYRVELFQQALDAGKTITFVGGSSNGPGMVGGQPFPQQHEGHSGWTVQQIDDIVPSPALGVDPHIILLHIGTNDMYQTPAGAADRLANLIDEIIADSPEALLVVSTIIPFPGATNEVNTYNIALQQVVTERIDAGDFVLLVDQFTDFPESELGDGVHPNAAGYARMAGVWWTAIEPYLP